MKNVVIFILVIGLVVVGYYAATTNLRLRLEGLEGKAETIIRGDLTLPINATGEVKPNLRVEIKPEASGEVIEIARQAGDRVKAGDLLIRLLPDDEQRSVDRAQQELASTRARLETAKIRLELAKGADLRNAEAQVKQLEPMVELAAYRLKKTEDLPEEQTNPEEILTRTTEYNRQVASLNSAQAAYEKAKLAIPLAEQAVNEAEAAFAAAQATLGDAQKRLNETSITSPIDGVVADIRTQIGAVVQGGKTTITGGSILAVVLDRSRIIVQAEVDESDVGRVLEIAPDWAKPGRDADKEMPSDLAAAVAAVAHPPEISVESYREDEFMGVIEKIYPEPKAQQSVVTYLVDVVVTSENRDKLQSGMRADIRFTSEHVSNAILCPNEAIKEGPDGRLGVYIPKPGTSPQDRKSEFVPCRFGLDNGAYSEVIEGLSEGMTVYTKLPQQTEERGRG